MAEVLQVSEPTPPESITKDELRELLQRAGSGDERALPRLRAVLQAEAEGRRRGGVLEAYGSPPEWLRWTLSSKASGKDLAIREAALVRMDQLRRELEGPSPSPLERLLAERAVVCWFQVYLYENTYANAKGLMFRDAEYHLRRIDGAHRRFLSAVRTLAQVRKLALPVLQVYIATNQVNTARAGS